MKYINQLEYPHIPYRTHAKIDTVSEADKMKSVSRSGCGPCSTCMAVDLLTDKSLDIAECIRISEECGANHSRGTDMTVLGPVIAEIFELDYSYTNDIGEAVEHLRAGGKIVVHVSIPEPGKLGLFTKGGHYMLLTSTDGKDFCILDPSYTPEKYLIPERVGKVDISHAPYLYCDINTVHAETKVSDKYPKYHLFKRKR